MKVMIGIVIAMSLLMSSSVYALKAGVPLEFKDEEQEELYNDMLHELRCTVCQNQSIAGSNASLADDLRGNLYKMVKEGADEGEIKKFMVDRYGDFVLYRPNFNPSTYLLWIGPFLLLLLGVIVLKMNVRSRNKINRKNDLTTEESELLADYLDSKKEKK
ncbi:Cytochrome c heme lyase subunit CcmL [hydrothermal vent metagenome]|uniref:Cytochrome c heme lyase subunit CcmL n=1 Tax=hydrothermal vent metagenome TaxID=652676 RepID=A0A3B0W5H2_9ZZZZ